MQTEWPRYQFSTIFHSFPSMVACSHFDLFEEGSEAVTEWIQLITILGKGFARLRFARFRHFPSKKGVLIYFFIDLMAKSDFYTCKSLSLIVLLLFSIKRTNLATWVSKVVRFCLGFALLTLLPVLNQSDENQNQSWLTTEFGYWSRVEGRGSRV